MPCPIKDNHLERYNYSLNAWAEAVLALVNCAGARAAEFQ
jgi:hypothetical protein